VLNDDLTAGAGRQALLEKLGEIKKEFGASK
jgi:hypothetical protein